MNIEEKTKIFEASCQKLLQKEITQLNKNIDSEIEKQIKDEVEEYEQKEEVTYNKRLEKLEKDYNKQMYLMQMESKKEILEAKKEWQKDLKKEVENRVKNYVNTPEYETFLFARIDETIRKTTQTQNCTLGITQQDYEKFASKIQEKYPIKLYQIANSYLGGCVLEDKNAGIYIDNTLQNSMEERFENH